MHRMESIVKRIILWQHDKLTYKRFRTLLRLASARCSLCAREKQNKKLSTNIGRRVWASDGPCISHNSPNRSTIDGVSSGICLRRIFRLVAGSFCFDCLVWREWCARSMEVLSSPKCSEMRIKVFLTGKCLFIATNNITYSWASLYSDSPAQNGQKNKGKSVPK